MLAARITLAHLSVSSAMSLPKFAEVPPITVPPTSANRALVLGSARTASISALSLLITSDGVLLGAPMPFQMIHSKPGTNSATEGMSGSASTRVGPVTASKRNLPALMNSMTVGGAKIQPALDRRVGRAWDCRDRGRELN